MIQQTPIGYFVLVPGAAGYQGPYPTETAARAVLSNATARYDRAQSAAPRKTTAKNEEPAPRVVKSTGPGAPRRERRARSAWSRRKHRKAARSLPAESLARAGLASVQRVD